MAAWRSRWVRWVPVSALALLGSALAVAGDPGQLQTQGLLGVRMETEPFLGVSQISPDNNPNTGTVDVFTRLNVREGPGTQYPIIGKLYPGEKLVILGTVNGWHKISWQGREAYVCAFYVHTAGEGWRNPGLAGAGVSGNGQQVVPQQWPQGMQWPQGYGPATQTALWNMPLIDQNTGGGSNPGGYCGPTAVRMVLAGYGIQTSADQIALGRFGAGCPMYQPGEGATHEGMATALRAFGCQVNQTTSHSLADLQRATSQGHPVIVNVKGNYGAGYTTSGHIMVVIGFDTQGNVVVNDPAGGRRRHIPPALFQQVWCGLFIEVAR